MSATAEDLQIQLSHTIDDYEIMRTSARRAVQDGARLLADALHALQNGSPAVTEEFLERVISSLDGVAVTLAPRAN